MKTKHLIYSNEDESHQDWYFSEQANLNFEVDGRIIAIADLGRWNGRFMGYRLMSRAVSSILDFHSCDFLRVYGEDRNIKATGWHHDGVNYILYRVVKEDRNIDNFLSKLMSGEGYSPSVLSYYTRSLYPDVANLYGW